MKMTIEATDHEIEQLKELVEVWIKERVEKIIEEKEAEEQAEADCRVRHASSETRQTESSRPSRLCKVCDL